MQWGLTYINGQQIPILVRVDACNVEMFLLLFLTMAPRPLKSYWKIPSNDKFFLSILKVSDLNHGFQEYLSYAWWLDYQNIFDNYEDVDLWLL